MRIELGSTEQYGGAFDGAGMPVSNGGSAGGRGFRRF